MYHGMQTYGMATIGSKGQIVIPSDARADMNFKEGDKVVVIGSKEKGIVGIVPIATMDRWLEHMNNNMNAMQDAIKNHKDTPERFDD